MVVKDLSRNGTFVSTEGGEFIKVEHVADGDHDSAAGVPIELGSRIRLGVESDHRLEVMTDVGASGAIEAFLMVRGMMEEQAEEEKAEQKKKKKKGLLWTIRWMTERLQRQADACRSNRDDRRGGDRGIRRRQPGAPNSGRRHREGARIC